MDLEKGTADLHSKGNPGTLGALDTGKERPRPPGNDFKDGTEG